MKNSVKKRMLSLLMAVVVTGSLCIDMTVAAQEASEENVAEDSIVPFEETEEAVNSEGQEKESTVKEISTLEAEKDVQPQEVDLAQQSKTRTAKSIVKTGTCGDGLTWKLTSDGILTVSGSGGIEDNAFASFDFEEEVVVKVILEDGVTEIGEYAFSGFENLVSIEFPESLTSIGNSAFFGCESLNSINIPNGVISIARYAFADCMNLTSIVLPESVNEIAGGAFCECDKLNSITVSGNNKYYRISDDGVLYKGQTELVVAPRNIKQVTISSSVTKIDDCAFEACTSLTDITVPSSVVDIGYDTFARCQNLTNITIPNGVETIEYCAFRGSGLTEIIIPESITEIDEYAFQGCSRLKKITILSKGCFWKEQDDGIIFSQATVFYGYSGSTTENYTKKYGYKFVALDGNSTNSGNKNPAIKTSKIAVSGISKKIAIGKKITLTAVVTPANAANKAVTWASSNTKYATVSNKGVVTMKKAGAGKTVTITATATDGSGVKATYKIKGMKGVVKKVKVSGKKSVKAGKSVKLSKKVTASKGANKTLKWTSSNTKYATVSSSGKVSTKKAGKGKKVKITATATDGSNKKSSITIKIK